MYAEYHLDSPPPNSRFRRPWSPEPYETRMPGGFSGARREASDVSVEALDLADYARTLTRDQQNHPSQFRAHDPYPPSPRGSRPFSRESLQPPSLVSGAGSLSTVSSSRSPMRRPFSLPPSSQTYGSHGYIPPQIWSDDSHGHHSGSNLGLEPEVDIGNFPAFTRHWYEKERPKSPPNAYHSIPHDETFSPFDPSFPTHKYNSYDKIPFSDPSYPAFPPSSDSHRNSSRTLLPWGSEAHDQSLDVDADIKQERMRMLEREFATVGKPGFGELDEEHLIGTADQRGKMITEGPKKRIAVRLLEAIASIGAAASALYATLLIKTKGTPPPSGKPALYILYVLSILSFLAIFYIYLIYPYCCLGRRSKDPNLTEPGPGSGGMMVLPVQHMPGGANYPGGKKQKPKKGKKGQMPMGGDVQVNLIVDPTMFGGQRRAEESDDDDDEGTWVNSQYSKRSSAQSRRTPKRRSVFAGFAMEARWLRARKYLKWSMAFDVIAMLLWGAEFIVILIGPRCPPGGYQGWCDAYNFSTALACFSCALFALSVFFGVKDLHASSVSPRTRT